MRGCEVEAHEAHAVGCRLVEVLEAGDPERVVVVVGAGAHVAADVGVAALPVEDAARRGDAEPDVGDVHRYLSTRRGRPARPPARGGRRAGTRSPT